MRLGIFVFYDKEGTACSYVGYLLESLREIVHRLVVVVNGKTTEESRALFEVYASEVFIRENKGYDGGAYKDALTECIGLDAFRRGEWDELVLCNDTFYGPLYPWERVFSFMEDREADFWGLSSYYSDQAETIASEKKWQYHIQGYFLVCRKRLLQGKDFAEFWHRLPMPENYYMAIEEFEVGFTAFFCARGYTCTSYMELAAPEYSAMKEQVVYTKHTDEMIRRYHFPVVKRKALNPLRESYWRIMEFVKQGTSYDISMFEEHRCHLDGIGEQMPFSETELEKFREAHDRIFIYGHGEYGRGMARYFDFMGWHFEKFIVTEKNGEEAGDEMVMGWNEYEHGKGNGIVLAVGRAAAEEIKEILGHGALNADLFWMK